MNIMNMTPHAINLMDAEGTVIMTVEPSGIIARAAQTREQTGTLDLGNGVQFPVNKSVYGEVVGLPAAEEGTIYVVSALTAQAVPERADVFIVDNAVRDEAGRIIGCMGFAHI